MFTRISPRGSAVVILLVASLPATGQAQERSPHLLRVEGAAAASLDDGQSFGGGFGGGYEYRMFDLLGIAGSFVGDVFTDEDAGVPDNTGTYRGLDGRLHEVEADGVVYPDTKLRYYGVGMGPRLHALPASSDIDLWLGTGLKYVRIREESRVGLDVGLGADFKFGDKGFAVGSFVRYTQVIQPSGGMSDGSDDKFLQFGAALSWGGAGVPATQLVSVSEREPEPEAEPSLHSSDSDNDTTNANVAEGIVEAATDCSEVTGVTEDCPAKSELSEPIDIESIAPELVDIEPITPEPADIEPKPATSAPVHTQAMDLPTRVAFSLGAKAVTARGARNLREVLSVLKSESAIRKLLVIGHADDRGSAEVNQTLSTERAQAVVNWLVSQGVEPSRLQAVGRGAREPRVDGRSSKARRANRRVEFVVTDPAKGQVPTINQP